ncbi:MAG: hypothetical protein JWN00_3989 [Actinomycetia bacterium]|jgi:hypothetical protein|nr:hypothetical protein [Actinomycetes bacterium]
MTTPNSPGYYGGEPAPAQYQQQPGYSSAQAKGFLGSLFDFDFNNFIAPKLVKAIYIVLVVVLSIGGVIGAIAAISLMASGGAAVILGLLLLVLTPVLWLLGLMIYRVMLELMIVLFKISEDLRSIRGTSGALR